MKNTSKGLTRRDLLRGAASAAVIGATGGSLFGQDKPGAETDAVSVVKPTEESASARKAKVILIRDQKVLDASRQVNPKVLSRMLDEAVMALLGETKPEAAWGRLVHRSDTVGIKSNEWRFLPTPPALEEAIRQRVAGAGVEEERIGIGDRGVA